jgi:hypothetical protein
MAALGYFERLGPEESSPPLPRVWLGDSGICAALWTEPSARKNAMQQFLEQLRGMTNEELIEFGKDVRRRLANPPQRQLDEAVRSGSGGTNRGDSKNK